MLCRAHVAVWPTARWADGCVGYWAPAVASVCGPSASHQPRRSGTLVSFDLHAVACRCSLSKPHRWWLIGQSHVGLPSVKYWKAKQARQRLPCACRVRGPQRCHSCVGENVWVSAGAAAPRPGDGTARRGWRGCATPDNGGVGPKPRQPGAGCGPFRRCGTVMTLADIGRAALAHPSLPPVHVLAAMNLGVAPPPDLCRCFRQVSFSLNHLLLCRLCGFVVVAALQRVRCVC
jgi:hypothetical protein